uniref:Stress-related protein 1 n=1 Tax=Zea mays TaxID=4577 RepID=SRP1_MAIZE|nr:RecName: Full=Stress-related protein 1 [Zea mays]
MTSESSTPTGSTRALPASITRSSSSTLSTRPSASTPASTGSLTPSTSTASLVVSPPPARSPVVSTRATATTRPRLAAERPGSATTPCPCGDTDKQLAPCLQEGAGFVIRNAAVRLYMRFGRVWFWHCMLGLWGVGNLIW